MKRLLATLFSCVAFCLLTSAQANAYSNSRLIDDAVFDNVNSMSEQQIRDFINSRPTSCLAQSGAIFPEPITYFSYGGNVDAARVIYNSARYSDVNPQVILTTLQKEQSLITRTDCYERPSNIDSRNKAMGMGCPDGGACPAPAYAGFHQQVMKGTWQLGFNRQRAAGNISWGGNDNITYYGYMTQGNFKRCASCATVYYDGYGTIDGQATYMETAATASLYTYTPHLGQSFPSIFEGWFGSVLTPSLSWQILNQYAYTDQTKTLGKSTIGLLPGDRVYVGFKAKNTGNTTWNKSGINTVKTGTLSPTDRNSAFCDSWAYGCNRPAALQETSVAPGQTGTFEFWMRAPLAPGEYNERFGLVMEGVGWFPNQGLNFYSTVTPATFRWEFVNQYAYTDQTKTTGKSTHLLLPGDRVYVGFKAKNTGNVTWQKSGSNPVHVGMTRPLDRASPFYDASWLGTNRPAKLIETSVAPGQTGTFEFWIKAPKQGGSYREYYSLVAEGAAWMNDPGMNFYTNIYFAQYKWQLLDQYAYTDQTKTTGKSTTGLNPGNRVYLGFKAKNTGNITWHNTGNFPVHVGMTRPLDRLSLFFDGSWLGQNRPAKMLESSVPPGGIGTFEFWIKAPNQPGTYLEYFSLLAEGMAWMNDPGMNFYSTVQ